MAQTTGRLSAGEFRTLFAAVSAWDRTGEPAERGALRHLTPDRVAAAARLVRTGVTVPLGRVLDTHRGPANPSPAVHVMTSTPEPGGESDADATGTVHFATDYVGLDYHHDTHSHVDALCHVDFDGLLYGGVPAETVTSYGAEHASIAMLAGGLVGRGVLLDIPRVRGSRWVEPGQHVYRKDLEAAEHEQRVRVGTGDILLVRTGHARRLDELGPWDTTRVKAGLHPATVTFLAEREVAALGCDANSDTAPSTTDGVAFPVHVLAINAMGIHLLDYLHFEELAERCVREDRWEFLFVAAPLRVPGGTGSPVNPLAIF
ncbi:cyclase family protein [Actinopolymorpha sp. B9G3]|uniref:cyclase family protein n=1 Tax=Actinopolymorpha sp. B9G3 TaxID=3158970 RepID=UPI0032D8ECA6